MDLRKIKLPGYFWRYYSKGKMYEIIHVVKKSTEKEEVTFYLVDWMLIFGGDYKMVEVDNKKSYHFTTSDISKYEHIEILPSKAKRLILIEIFNNLKIKS